MLSLHEKIGIWFPTVRTSTGSDVFTIRLSEALAARGIRTQITWLPHHAEYLPWTVAIPQPPEWATVAHINSWMPNRFIPSQLPLAVTVHHCVHDQAFNAYKSPAQNLYHKFWVWKCEATTVRRADALTTVSHYTKRMVESIFHCQELNPIYNWVDTNLFAPRETRPPHAPFRLLFVGSMNIRKGIDLLDQIMISLGPDYELRCVCDPKSIPGRLTGLPNFIALGRMKTAQELADTYRASDALLFPSRLEGFGLVALEALSCGIPVIATNGSSLPEIVQHGVSGLLCPQDDIEAFANAARKLRNNNDLWQSMCHAAALQALTKFSEEVSINAYLQIYQRLSI